MTPLRWAAFADLDAGVWGATLIGDETGAGHLVLGVADTATVPPGEINLSDEAWQLRGDGFELAIAAGDGPMDRATGSFTLDADRHEVDAPASREALPDGGELDSLRVLAAWFDGDEALALSAARPRGARGQEGDAITASLVESGEARSVIDPRLSTTYGSDGIPSRAGVELWVSEPAAGEPSESQPAESQHSEEADSTTERPYRIAGEAAASGAVWKEGVLELAAYPFRCHSHGRDGTGVYLLGRPG